MASKIAFYTPCRRGGIYQFTEQLVRVALAVGFDACIIAPSAALNSSELPEGAKAGYEISRESTLYLKGRELNSIGRIINNRGIDLVVFTSPCGPAHQVMRTLSGSTQFDVVVHDVVFHSTHNIKHKIIYPLLRRVNDLPLIRNARKVWLLSNNSMAQFKEKYPRWCTKTVKFPLGAHAPECGRKRPLELGDVNDYLLFFGRLDAQKGLDRLLRSYSKANLENTTLVIAGNGQMTDEEIHLAESIETCCLIKRFIEDDEMMWLMENCMAVVLPYRDATQSGVLPLAYSCAKPVIASNIDGLREFIVEGTTGFLVDSEAELTARMRLLADNRGLAQKMGAEAERYSHNELDWTRNIKKVLELDDVR